MQKLITSILDLIYPPDKYCYVCGKPVPPAERPVCGVCWAKVDWIRGKCCQLCGRPFGSLVKKDVCADCRQRQVYYSGACAAAYYHGTMREILHTYKYRGKQNLAEKLAGYLVPRLQQQPWYGQVDTVVPVPLHSSKLRQRGFNQAALLAAIIARKRGLPLADGNLCRVKATPSLNRLNADERRSSLHDAFAVRFPAKLAGRRILLVDDILTTGSTANECARVLHAAGAIQVYVTAVAAKQAAT